MMYGLDIGGSKIELAIFDGELKPVDSWRLPTPKHDYSLFLDTVVAMVEDADRKIRQKGSVGIGLPCIVNNQGFAVSANIPCINGQRVAAALLERLRRPVGVEHDANAFVYSEVHGGAADGAKHALGVVLGTGVGGGLCVDSELYVGRQRLAVECGHMAMPGVLLERYRLPLLQCGCGALGCVERYLSGPGLLQMCRFFGIDCEDTASVIEELRAGEVNVVSVFDTYMQCLGFYFSQLVLLYDPEVIVLGGGLSKIPEIYQRIDGALQAHLMKGVIAPAILPPTFGDSSGVRGAALIGREQIQAAEKLRLSTFQPDKKLPDEIQPCKDGSSCAEK